MAGIRDVAKLANVSPSTASRVLSGNAYVEPNTKEKVLNAMKELGYKPNYAARSLKNRGSNKMFGLIIPDITNPYYPELVKKIEQVANNAGCSMILCETLGDAEKEKRFFESLMHLFVDGIIFISSTNSIEHIRPYIGKIPLVFLNRVYDVEAPCISLDNAQAAYDAVNYLIKFGHRKISVLINNTENQYNKDRLSGSIKAFKENGIKDYEQFIIRNIDSIEDAYEKTDRMLNSGERPTAFFIFNDYLSFGVYKAINKNGLSIPTDISVMGFDDTLQVRYLNPPLTTIRHTSADNAQYIFDALMSENRNHNNKHSVTLFKGNLIERESVTFPKEE